MHFLKKKKLQQTPGCPKYFYVSPASQPVAVSNHGYETAENNKDNSDNIIKTRCALLPAPSWRQIQLSMLNSSLDLMCFSEVLILSL